MAQELDKPLIIHTRDARDDTLALLKEGRQSKLVVFCIALPSH